MKAQKVSFATQWTPQSQFSGFYLALEKGFYADEGLDVEISSIPLNSAQSVLYRLTSGGADIVGQQLVQGLIARSDGYKVVNVMQLTQQTGLCCASHTPIKSIKDLEGMKVGKWKAGISDFFEVAQLRYNVNFEWVDFLNDGLALYMFGAIDAMLCYYYSELVDLELSIGKIPKENVLSISLDGTAYPEDGLFVTEEYYRNNRETVEKFVRATKKGWDYARSHMDEALEISRKYMKEAGILRNAVAERMMLERYLELQVNPVTGEPDYAPVRRETFDEIQNMLLETGSITVKVEYDDLIR